MITTPTVFILGPGVSMPYGFPSDKALLNQIYETTKSSIVDLSNDKPILHEIGKMLREEFGDKLVMEIGDELYLSQQASIDVFLEHRPEFIKIGKTAIALCLACMENEEKLFEMDVRDKGCKQRYNDMVNEGCALRRLPTLAKPTFYTAVETRIFDRRVSHRSDSLFTSLTICYIHRTYVLENLFSRFSSIGTRHPHQAG